MRGYLLAAAAAVTAAAVFAGTVTELTGGTCAELPVAPLQVVQPADRLAPACAETLQGCPDTPQ